VLDAGERIVLVVDQFEEVFTACSDGVERSAFVAALTEAAGDPRGSVVVVLALRADYYGRCAADPGLAELLGANLVLVGSMTAEEYRRAIEQPALRVGVRLDPVLVDELVGEVLGEPGALPLLSTALLELWERRDGRLIRTEAYGLTGGVRGAVARMAEEVYAGFDAEQQATVRSVLLRLAGPGQGSDVVRRRVSLAEFDAERNERVSQVLDALTARRLLTLSEGSVEVAHEALLREWPRFQDWLEEDREGRRLRAHLIETAREWADSGRDPADLYRGARLATALDWTTQHTLELNEVEREFVNASRAENERELTRQRTHNRRLRGALVGVGVLLLLAIAAGGAALVARSNAQHSATVALARQLGAEAVSEPRVDRAMLLAREAVDLNQSPETEGTLLATLLRSPAAAGVSTMPITVRPLQLAVSPDGKTLAVAVNAPETWFFDTRTHRQSHTPLEKTSNGIKPVYSRRGGVLLVAGAADHADVLDVLDARTLKTRTTLRYDPVFLKAPINSQLFAVSPDGRTAFLFYALSNQDGSDGPAYVDRWDIATGKRTVFSLGSKGLPGAGLTSDGKKVITVTDTAITTWDARTMRRLLSVAQPVALDPAPILAAVSPDGQTAAFGTPLGTVIFVDTRTGEARPGAGGHTSDVQDLAWLPNSRDLVSTGDDARVIVWDAATAQPIETLLGHAGRVSGVTVSADGRTAYTASLDGSIFQWDVGAGRRFGRPLPPPQTASPPDLAAGGVGQPTPPLAVSPDGSMFAALVGPSVVALYATRTAGLLRQFPVNTGGNVTSVAWSRKGPLVVTGENGSVQLWDVQGTPRLIRALMGLHSQNGQPEAVISAAASPDGLLVAAGDVNHTPGTTPYRFGTVAVWDAGSGRLLWKNTSKRGTVTSVAFSPDGTLVAAGYENGEVVLYDAATGRVERTLQLEGGGGFETLAFAPDGTLATGTWAGIVQLWNPATGRQIGHPTLVTPSPVASLSFDPKGDVFSTTGGSDGTAKLWTTKTQQQFGATFPGDPGHWGNAVFTPDGSKLIVFYEDGTGFVWPTSVDAWKDHACAVAGRNFTREEWRRFVSGHSYAKTCPSFPEAP
jgi:WD40 repeat protein